MAPGRGLVVDEGFALEAEARRRHIVVEAADFRGLAVIAVDFDPVNLARERELDGRVAGADRVRADRAEARRGRGGRIGIARRTIRSVRRIARAPRDIARLLGHGNIAVFVNGLLALGRDRQRRGRRNCRLGRLQLLHLGAQRLHLGRLRRILRGQGLQLLGQRIQLRLQRSVVVARRHGDRRHRQRQSRPRGHKQTGRSRPSTRDAPCAQKIHLQAPPLAGVAPHSPAQRSIGARRRTWRSYSCLLRSLFEGLK